MLKKILLNFRSEYYWSDLFGLVLSLLFRPKHVWTSSRIVWQNQGKVESANLVIGLASNRLGLIPFSRGIVNVKKGGFLKAGRGVRISHGCRIFVKGTLEIGASTYFNPHCNLVVHKHIKIGSNCAIGWNFQAMDTDLHQITDEQGHWSPVEKPIEIGNHVWIGSNVSVFKGVTIGDGAVIASGTLVTKDVAPGTLVGGVPARIIRQGIEWK